MNQKHRNTIFSGVLLTTTFIPFTVSATLAQSAPVTQSEQVWHVSDWTPPHYHGTQIVPSSGSTSGTTSFSNYQTQNTAKPSAVTPSLSSNAQSPIKPNNISQPAPSITGTAASQPAGAAPSQSPVQSTAVSDQSNRKAGMKKKFLGALSALAPSIVQYANRYGSPLNNQYIPNVGLPGQSYDSQSGGGGLWSQVARSVDKNGADLGALCTDPDQLYEQGKAFRRQNNDKAIECFCRAIAARPDFEKAYFERGCCLDDIYGGYANNVSSERTIRVFPEVSRLDSFCSDASRGYLLLEIKDFRKTAELNPSNQRAWCMLGKSTAQLGKKKDAVEAIGYLDRAIALDPNYASAYAIRGRARMLASRNLSAGNADYQRACQLDASQANKKSYDQNDLRTAWAMQAQIGDTNPDNSGSYIPPLSPEQTAAVLGHCGMVGLLPNFGSEIGTHAHIDGNLQRSMDANARQHSSDVDWANHVTTNSTSSSIDISRANSILGR